MHDSVEHEAITTLFYQTLNKAQCRHFKNSFKE